MIKFCFFQETAAALLPGRSRPLPAHLPSSMWATSHPSLVSSSSPSCHLQRRTHRCEQPGCDKVGSTLILIAKVSSVHCSTSGLALGSPGCRSFVCHHSLKTLFHQASSHPPFENTQNTQRDCLKRAQTKFRKVPPKKSAGDGCGRGHAH